MPISPSPRVGRALTVAVAALSVALLGLSSGALPTVAQEATPDASTCTIPPIDTARIAAMIAGIAPIATPTTSPASVGAPVDAAIVSAVDATIRESVACVNANQPLRWFALFTDRYLVHRFGGAHADDLGHLVAAATRAPLPAADADRLTLIDVAGIRTLPDGRVTAGVVTGNRVSSFTDQLTFADIDGRWLIDDVVETPPKAAATPAV